MKKFFALLLTIATLAANPLIVRDPQFFSQTVSVQVDFIPEGAGIHLETFCGGLWKEIAKIDRVTAPSVSFALPLTTNQIYRAYYILE
jgi:hypothetical protein